MALALVELQINAKGHKNYFRRIDFQRSSDQIDLVAAINQHALNAGDGKTRKAFVDDTFRFELISQPTSHDNDLSAFERRHTNSFEKAQKQTEILKEGQNELAIFQKSQLRQRFTNENAKIRFDTFQQSAKGSVKQLVQHGRCRWGCTLGENNIEPTIRQIIYPIMITIRNFPRQVSSLPEGLIAISNEKQFTCITHCTINDSISRITAVTP